MMAKLINLMGKKSENKKRMLSTTLAGSLSIKQMVPMERISPHTRLELLWENPSKSIKGQIRKQDKHAITFPNEHIFQRCFINKAKHFIAFSDICQHILMF